jgi:hypothetical protein
VDHSLTYSKYEHITLALSHYHGELRLHNQDSITNTKPVVIHIAKLYDVAETSLRCHIRNPNQCILEELRHDCQILTVAEEKILIERLLFSDYFNVSVSRIAFYSLAQNLLTQRNPSRSLGKNWIYRFLGGHKVCR